MLLPCRYMSNGPVGVAVQLGAGEGLRLGPDAGVEHADDDAGARLRNAAALGPHTAGAGATDVLEAEEVGGVPGVCLEGDILDQHQHVAVGGQHGRLTSGQLGGEGVGGQRRAAADCRAHAASDLVLLLDEVALVVLHALRAGVEGLARLDLGGLETRDAAVVAGRSGVAQDHDVATGAERARRLLLGDDLAVAGLGAGGGGRDGAEHAEGDHSRRDRRERAPERASREMDRNHAGSYPWRKRRGGHPDVPAADRVRGQAHTQAPPRGVRQDTPRPPAPRVPRPRRCGCRCASR